MSSAMLGLERVIVGGVYVLLGTWVLVRQRAAIPRLLRDGFRTDLRAMADADG